MPIEQHKLKAFLAWDSARNAFVAEMQAVMQGKAECDTNLMKGKADELTNLFEEYRRVWGLN